MAHVEVTPDMKHVAIPITLPYWNDQSNYRVTHGKIMIDGKLYRKVLQKYEQDAIHLIVAEDSQTERLNNTIADWVRAMSDSESSSNDKADLIKSAAKDYTLYQQLTYSKSLILLAEQSFGTHPASNTLETYPELNTPPPRG